MRGVLLLEPGAADPEDRAPAADVVERGDRLCDKPGISERFRSDQQAELGAFAVPSPRRQVEQPSKIGWSGSPKIAYRWSHVQSDS